MAAINGIWGAFNWAVSTANLPSDTNDAWKALMSVPELLPFGLAALSLGVLGWSLLPPKQSAAQETSSEEAEADRLYRLKRAELEAEDRVRRERASRRIFGMDIGAAFADVLEEQEADRKAEAEARRQRMIREASLPPPPPPSPKFDMPLKAVLERIAFESEWAVTRDWSSPSDAWQETIWGKPLGKELLRPLASGEMPSRGIRSDSDGDEHGHSDIPAEFWRNAKLGIEADRLLCEPGCDFVMRFGDRVTYHDIRLRSVDVNEEWPARSAEDIAARPSPFVEWAREWKARFEERLANAQVEREKYDAADLAKRRRKLIAEARQIVAAYEPTGEDDRLYLESQPAFLQIRKYLSESFHQKFSSAAINVEIDGGRVQVGHMRAFSRELDRLETQWGLDLHPPVPPRTPIPPPSHDPRFVQAHDELLDNVERTAERTRGSLDMSSMDHIKRAIEGKRTAPARKRDTTISEALAYAALGRWGESFAKALLHFGEWSAGKPFVERFWQAADKGELTVWGKRGVGPVYERIPRTYWREHSLDYQSLLMGRASTTPMVEMEDTVLFTDLMVNRQEVERTWPHAG